MAPGNRQTEFGLEEPANLVLAQTFVLELLYKNADALLGAPSTLAARALEGAIGDERTGALPHNQEALMLEFGVGLHDGVGTDDQLLGQGPNTWKKVSWLHGTKLDGMSNLFDELDVERLS